MKLNKSVEAVLGSEYAYSVTEALINFFGAYVEDVYEYNELQDELKKVMPECIFEYLTKKKKQQKRK